MRTGVIAVAAACAAAAAPGAAFLHAPSIGRAHGIAPLISLRALAHTGAVGYFMTHFWLNLSTNKETYSYYFPGSPPHITDTRSVI